MPEEQLLIDGPETAPLTVALAHGAGAPMDSPFMSKLASLLGEAGWRVVRFEFPYMATRRSDGRRRPPDREAVLVDTWKSMISMLGSRSLVVGGKSMGGRIASLVADGCKVRGVVCMGYPFHPPGRPTRVRTAHLATLQTPTLIVQGTRDPFGRPEEVREYSLSKSIAFHWIESGDHSLKPLNSSPLTPDEALQDATAAVDRFLVRLSDKQ